MAKIISITPLTRCSEYVEINAGFDKIYCYSKSTPHYYKDSLGVLQPIDVTDIADSTSTIGDIKLIEKSVSSVGLRTDGVTDKYLGLRPDEVQLLGTEQLEISLSRFVFNGLEDDILLSIPVFDDKNTQDLGSVKVWCGRNNTRQLVPFPVGCTSFRLEFKLELKGLTISHHVDSDTYVIRNSKGKFRYRIKRPYFVGDDFRPLINDEWENYYSGLITHDLIDNHDGTYTYIKESSPKLATVTIPVGSYIDVDTVYSETSDGRIANGDADWDTVHDAGTGTSVDDTAHLTPPATSISAFYYSAVKYINRSFFYFDVSGVSGTATGVDLLIYGSDLAESDTMAQEGTQAGSLTTADYDSFTGSSFGDVSWSTAAYNTISFNAGGISYINSVIGSSTALICCREKSHDYDDVDCSTSQYRNRCYYADEEGTNYDPKLEITLAAGANAPTGVLYGPLMGPLGGPI